MTPNVYKPVLAGILLGQLACGYTGKDRAAQNASVLDLKRGKVISCGPVNEKMFGSVAFTASVPEALQADFNMGVALLHSFEYDEAEKMFARVIDQAPGCAMAYWGVAMSNLHTLWAPPSAGEMEKGRKALALARSAGGTTARESDYIAALAAFYEGNGERTHRARLMDFEKAMEGLYARYRGDKEARIFYALALNAAADPTDKTYARQRKAIALLMPLFETEPMHPGVAHYIIHNSDYPELAAMALPAARKYASIAPASSHALHMPSHIFTRLGLWSECIQSNMAAQSAAQCYAEQAGLKGHWDEELHATDYLVYAYLQRGEDEMAKKQVDYLLSFDRVDPVSFKTAYAFAASPARYLLERKQWAAAMAYEAHPAGFPWEKFPWQKGIVHFTRMLGAVHTGHLARAKMEVTALDSVYAVLQPQQDKQKEAAQVAVQAKTGRAWIAFREGHVSNALAMMTAAADMEDASEKHPVTPGEIIPARELLGEMLLLAGRPGEALAAFEAALASHHNRLNALYGASVAAAQSGQTAKAAAWLQQIAAVASTDSPREAVRQARGASPRSNI